MGNSHDTSEERTGIEKTINHTIQKGEVTTSVNHGIPRESSNHKETIGESYSTSWKLIKGNSTESRKLAGRISPVAITQAIDYGTE